MFELHKTRFPFIYNILNDYTYKHFTLYRQQNINFRHTNLLINSISLNKVANIPFYDYYFIHHYTNYYFNSYLPLQLDMINHRNQQNKTNETQHNTKKQQIKMDCYFDIMNENFEYYGYIKQTNTIEFEKNIERT